MPMTTPYKNKLDNKLITVIDYIDKHLDDDLSLDNLAAVPGGTAAVPGGTA